jgi:hypothetical protein
MYKMLDLLKILDLIKILDVQSARVRDTAGGGAAGAGRPAVLCVWERDGGGARAWGHTDVGDNDDTGDGGSAGHDGWQCCAGVSDNGGRASLLPVLCLHTPFVFSGSRMGRAGAVRGFYTLGPSVPVGITNHD